MAVQSFQINREAAFGCYIMIDWTTMHFCLPWIKKNLDLLLYRALRKTAHRPRFKGFNCDAFRKLLSRDNPMNITRIEPRKLLQIGLYPALRFGRLRHQLLVTGDDLVSGAVIYNLSVFGHRHLRVDGAKF